MSNRHCKSNISRTEFHSFIPCATKFDETKFKKKARNTECPISVSHTPVKRGGNSESLWPQPRRLTSNQIRALGHSAPIVHYTPSVPTPPRRKLLAFPGWKRGQCPCPEPVTLTSPGFTVPWPHCSLIFHLLKHSQPFLDVSWTYLESSSRAFPPPPPFLLWSRSFTWLGPL